jgi:hypothetical protein
MFETNEILSLGYGVPRFVCMAYMPKDVENHKVLLKRKTGDVGLAEL